MTCHCFYDVYGKTLAFLWLCFREDCNENGKLKSEKDNRSFKFHSSEFCEIIFRGLLRHQW